MPTEFFSKRRRPPPDGVGAAGFKGEMGGVGTARTAATTNPRPYGGRAEPGALRRRLVRLQYTVSMVPNSNMQSHHMMTAGSPHMPTANPAGAIALISLAPSPPDRANASNAITPRLSSAKSMDCSTVKNVFPTAAAMILDMSCAKEPTSTHGAGT